MYKAPKTGLKSIKTAMKAPKPAKAPKTALKSPKMPKTAVKKSK